MAVDYTQLFTLIGKYVHKINTYYDLIADYDTDQAAIETTLASESLVRLGDGLDSVYDGFREQISGNISQLVDRISTILTDEELVGQQFYFGSVPSITAALKAIINDGAGGAFTIKNSTPTAGAITYDVTHTGSIGVHRSFYLDGTMPPLAGAPSIPNYTGLTSQLTPTSETISITCVSDSETDGVTQGSEVFQITGTGDGSSGYSVEGENVGNLGSIIAVDNINLGLISNAGFDSWTTGVLDSWTNEASDTCLEEGSPMRGTSGSSLKTIQDDTVLHLSQTIPAASLKRNRLYFLTLWAAKDTDVALDQSIDVVVTVNGTPYTTSVAPTGTAFEFSGISFLIPAELTADVTVEIGAATCAATKDAVIIDNLVISEAQYFAGVAMALSCGAEKVLRGDSAMFTLSNNNGGVFQTFFRKAYGVQLPSSGSPTISDSLVA